MKKGKTMRRMMSALLAMLLCMSCVCSPMAFAAEDNEKIPQKVGYTDENTTNVEFEAKNTQEPDGEEPKEPPAMTEEPAAADGEATQADETDEPGVSPLDAGESGGTATPDQTAESMPEATMSEAAQMFVDAVSAIDHEAVLSTANAWGLAHLAWMQNQDDPDLTAALDAATAASDDAAAALYTAEDLFYEIPEVEQENGAVQAAFTSLMSLIVTMHEIMDNPTDTNAGGDEPPIEPGEDEIAAILYGDLPDAPTGSYLGSYGLPVATGETKISIGAWETDLLSNDRMDANALNSDSVSITVPLQAGEEYAIIPILTQVEYPAHGSSSTVILPDGATLLSQDGSGGEARADEAEQILNASYHESSAAVSGFCVQAAEDFAVRFLYESPDGTVLEKTAYVYINNEIESTERWTRYGLRAKGRTAYAGRPTPSATTGKVTRVEKVNGTWLIWFNGEPAYCCTHGAHAGVTGCPTYTYAYTSIVGGYQYTPGDHYKNQIEIWGGLGQLSLGLLHNDGTALFSADEAIACYDSLQQWVMEHYPDSIAARAYQSAIDQLTSDAVPYATESDYYTYIYLPPAGYNWQTVAVIGPPTDGSEPPDVEAEYYADWEAPAQTASGEFDFSYTVNTDKKQLETGEKVDGAVIEIEPMIKSGTIDGGSWAISPAAAQTVTTSGHTQDGNFHQNGGDGTAAWSLHYEVSKTSGTRSGSVGPYSSQSEADDAADSAREDAIDELRGEAQTMVDAAIDTAKQTLASLQFSYQETGVPYGFEPFAGGQGSSQTITVPANINQDYPMFNDEWSLQIKIKKVDSETGSQIAADAEFAVFEWDTVTQRYIPFGGYNQYAVERQTDGTYMVVNHSGYATADPALSTMFYTQRNEGKFIIVETSAPTGYYGDWADISHPGAADSVKGKRAYFIELTKANDGSVIWLDNADYNAHIGTTNNGDVLLDTGSGIVSVRISDNPLVATKTYVTDKSGIAANEDSRTVQPVPNQFLNDRVLGEIVLNKVDLDAMRYLAAGSNGNTTLEGAVYDLYAAEDIRHPDGVTGIVDYAKITDASGAPIWHTTVLTNGGWDNNYLPVLKKDHLVASAAIKDGRLAFANLYLGRYYLVERATGIVLPLNANGQIVLDTSYPILNRQLQPTGSTHPLTRNSAGEYTDYVYKNRYSAVAEGRALSGTRTFDGYYLSFASGYLCDEINHYVTLAYGNESGLVVREEVQSEDEVLKSGFSINKLISTTGQPGPAVKLDGAGFTVYRVSDLSRAGQFTQNPDGSYQVQSILDAYRADSYDQDTPKYDFSGESNAIAMMYEGNQAAVDSYNRSLTTSADNANGSGAGWQPTGKPNEYQLGEVFTNEEGILRVDGLAYGQYLVVETTVPKDVFQAAPFMVTVNASAPQSVFCTPQGSTTVPSGNYMTYNILDEELEGYLQLIKIDAETGKAVKLAKTAFSIYRICEDGSLEIVEMNDPASGNATVKTSVFYTDADGLLKTPEKLPLGRYRVVEVQGPEGYFNDESYYVDFEITSERIYEVIGSSADGMDDYIVTERYVNRETLGQLTIRKEGEVLAGWKDGQFIYEKDTLSGAVYEIRAHGDVFTGDHQMDANGNRTLWYADGDLVATVTTGSDGQIDKTEFAPTRTPATYNFLTISHNGAKGEVTITLPLGSYDIIEVKAPYGYTLTGDSYTVTFGWDSQKNDLVLAKTIVSHTDGKDKETAYRIVNVEDVDDRQLNGQKLIYENKREKAKVGVYKVDEETGAYLAGAVFALYTVDDIYDAYGNLVLSAGELIATSPKTTVDGYTCFDADIPIRGEQYGASEDKDASTNSGNYFVQEITAPAGYFLHNEKMPVTFTYDGQAVMVLDNTCPDKPTEMWISKRALTGSEELPGARLQIVDKRGDIVREWISSEIPQRITGLHTDEEYTLVEQTAPNGYAIAESIRFKLVQKIDENSALLSEVEVYVCTGKDWIVFDHWELVEDCTVIMRDAPEQPKEPDAFVPPQLALPIPKTGDLPWLSAMLAVTGTLCVLTYALWTLFSHHKKNEEDTIGGTENKEP